MWFGNWLARAIVAAVILSAVACDSDGLDAKAERFAAPLPSRLSPAALPADGTLSAWLAIDDAPDVQLPIVGDRVAANVEVSRGLRTFRLSFTFLDRNGTNWLVARSPTRTLNVDSDVTLSFEREDYTYPDADADALSNLIELERGTDPGVATGRDATLRDLALVGIALEPSFAPVVSGYTATVGFSTSSTEVLPTPSDNRATVRVNGTVVDPAGLPTAVALAEGTNTITIELTAEDLATIRVYSVTVTRGAPPQLQARRAFVTSVSGDGNLSAWADAGGATGLDAADAICQARADLAGLSGVFRAWMSDDSDDAYCRMHDLSGKKSNDCGQASLPSDAGPWERTDGVPFAGSIAELAAGVVYTPLRRDEFGATLPVRADPPGSSVQVWVGTDAQGLARSDSCLGWTTNAFDPAANDNPLGSLGNPANYTGNDWTEWGGSSCNASTNRLVCLQTAGAGRPLSGFGASGNVVFLTSASGTGNLASWPDAGAAGGLAAGDEICRARAGAAGLDNPQSFRAWLSDDSIDAPSRLTSLGPWVRPDGLLVAANRAELVSGTLRAPINQDETGAYIAAATVLTGTAWDGASTGSNCSNWTDAQAPLSTGGVVAAADFAWTDGFANCNNLVSRLYCFED